MSNSINLEQNTAGSVYWNDSNTLTIHAPGLVIKGGTQEYDVFVNGLDGAIIMASDSDWTVGAARDLRIVEWGSWDADKARESMFDAGFDVAKRGHLVYDSANDEVRGSYKLPFAAVEDGELVAVKEGLRAAASRLPQTDIPDDVRERARAVLDSYFERMDSEDKVVIRDDAPMTLYYVRNGRMIKFGKVLFTKMVDRAGHVVVEFNLLD